MTRDDVCPRCQCRLATGHPEGLCPGCLLQLGLDRCGPEGDHWLDVDACGLTVLNVIEAADDATSYLAEQHEPSRRFVVLTSIARPGTQATEPGKLDAMVAALASFHDPHVARVLGAAVDAGGNLVLVSEFVAGTPLLLHCARTRTGGADAAALLLPVAEGLARAHGAGLFHGRLTAARVAVTVRQGAPAAVVIGLGVGMLSGTTAGAAADLAAVANLAEAVGLPLPPSGATAREVADHLRVIARAR